ncbi:MAG: DNA-binding protein [Candidatus Aenigmatarchaeota archaeon]
MFNEIKNIHIFRIEKNQKLLEALNDYVLKNQIMAGYITAIGALKKVNVGYFINKKYIQNEAEGSFEIGSCNGIISLKEKIPFIHLHIVCQNDRGETLCGHVLDGSIVFPTVEVIIFEFKNLFERKFDEETGLFLLNLK